MKANEYKEVFQSFFQEQNRDALEAYILENSYLPGPAGNLIMTYGFADYLHKADICEFEWNLLKRWGSLCINDCSGDEAMVLLPFCAIQAFGSIYYKVSATIQNEIKGMLRSSMNDERWRIRESVAMAYQRMGEDSVTAMITIMEEIYPSSTLYEKRAILAALAHPQMLSKEPSIVTFSLQISENILHDISKVTSDLRKSADYVTLVKAACYAISVFIVYDSEAGFALIERFIASEDKGIKKIIKENLKKGRLTKKFPKQVECYIEKLKK